MKEAVSVLGRSPSSRLLRSRQNVLGTLAFDSLNHRLDWPASSLSLDLCDKLLVGICSSEAGAEQCLAREEALGCEECEVAIHMFEA